jgi:hypothetical protein
LAEQNAIIAGVMKNKFFVFLLLIFPFVFGCDATAQKSSQTKVDAPTSTVINAAELLRDLETLATDDMQGRRAGTPGGARARQFVEKRFREIGLQPLGDSFIQPFEFSAQSGKLKGANVVGLIKGKTAPDKFIVVTAHYDHLGVQGGQIYNGADDNASGTSALFALAKHFSANAPANSIIFAALDNEEGGGAGARTLVETFLREKRNVRLNVNLDMVSHSEAGELYAAGTYHYPFLKPYLEKIAANARVKLLFGHDSPDLPVGQDWTFQSDHGAFHREKIPFVYFGVEDHKDYHRPTDDFATITPEFYVRAVETILAAIKEFDRNLAQIEKQKTAPR